MSSEQDKITEEPEIYENDGGDQEPEIEAGKQLDTFQQAVIDELVKTVDVLKNQIKTMKEDFKSLKELELLKYGNKNILEGITKHVMGSAFTNKVRELRKEFFSKAEFKNETMKLLTKSDLEFLKKDNSNQFQLFKNDLESFRKNESSFQKSINSFQ